MDDKKNQPVIDVSQFEPFKGNCPDCGAEYMMGGGFGAHKNKECPVSERADKLTRMWFQQETFMRLLQKKRNFPNFPVDLTSKAGQKFVKTISYECADELHEARQHLKNKDHRATTINEIDRAEYVEELVDSLHYFFEIVIASGISLEEMFEAYMKKGETNTKRINEGY